MEIINDNLFENISNGEVKKKASPVFLKSK